MKRAAVLATAALLVLSLAGCSSGRLTAPPLRDSITVDYDTAAVTRGDVVRLTAYDGYVRATVENLTFSKDFGTMGEVYVSVGDRVEAGDVLARLDSTVYDTALTTAQEALAARSTRLESDRRKAEIAISLAELDLSDAKARGNKNAVSQASLEVSRLQNELKQLNETADLEIKKLERDIAQAETELADIELIAPCSGEVVAVPVSRPGTRVTSSTTILMVADDSRLYIQYDGGETLTNNYLKDKVIVARCGSGEYLLDPVLYSQEEYTRLILSGARPPARFQFKDAAVEAVPGDFAEVLIYEVDQKDVLRVPVNALYNNGGTPYVYLIQNGEKVYAEVEIGARSNSFVEIISGVEEGEIVYVKQ